MLNQENPPKFSNSFVLGIDADDTLWENEAWFYKIQDRFFELMSSWSDPKETNAALLENEKASIPQYGYGVTSFVRSMILTAIQISNDEIGTKQSNNHHLLLITKGDVLHQRTKDENSGLTDFFWNIEVVGEKDAAIYEMLLNRYGINPEMFVMIGNSVSSDILPVLTIGAKAIHVPHHTTWELEIPDPKELEKVDFPTAQSISEVPGILSSWNE